MHRFKISTKAQWFNWLWDRLLKLAQKYGIAIEIVNISPSTNTSHIRLGVRWRPPQIYIKRNPIHIMCYHLAHELGHWKLHQTSVERCYQRGIPERIVFNEQKRFTELWEQEAQRFADKLIGMLYLTYKRQFDK